VGFSRRVRNAAIVIVIVVLGFVAYQVYDFYTNRVGVTATKTVEMYFAALSQGNLEEVARLTDRDHLTDIYGRSITPGEFQEQLKKLTGGYKMAFTEVKVVQIAEKQNSRFYLVTMRSEVSAPGQSSRLLVEVRRTNSVWLVTYPFAIVLQG
jgi:hypothetical protein